MSNKINADDFVVVEVNEENPKASKVERHNIVSDFTLEQIEEHQADLVKFEKELTSQVGVCQATIDNIERNHEFVKDLSAEQKHHVWMWYENNTVKENSEKKLELVKEQMEQYGEISAILKDKLNIDEQEETATEESKE